MPIQTPFGLFTPEQLAAMAQAAFKPPQGGMQMSGMGQPQQAPGMNVAKGIGALGDAAGDMMSGWKPSGKDEQGAVGPGGLSGAVSGVNALKPDANGVWQQPPMPTDIGYGQGGGGPLTMQDFWSGKWLPTLGFGGGGGQGGGGGFYP